MLGSLFSSRLKPLLGSRISGDGAYMPPLTLVIELTDDDNSTELLDDDNSAYLLDDAA